MSAKNTKSAANKSVNPYPQGVLYKFLDEATGLFWTGAFDTEFRRGSFSEKGLELRSQKVAENVFRTYEFRRVRLAADGPDENFLPILKIVTYRVIIEEIERVNFVPNEAEMRVTCIAALYGGHLDKFVRQLFERKDFMEFTYIIQRATKSEVDVSALDNPVISSRKTERKFIAVRSTKDLLFLRMSLGDGCLEVYDLSNGARLLNIKDKLSLGLALL